MHPNQIVTYKRKPKFEPGLSAKEIQKYQKYSVAKLKAMAQKYFNRFIRERDKDKPCISCNTGKPEQCGHYLSQGHHSALRYDENNCAGQCVRCNLYLHGNLVNFRKGLIKRIGEEKVIEMETRFKGAHKWGRFSLIEILTKYKPKP